MTSKTDVYKNTGFLFDLRIPMLDAIQLLKSHGHMYIHVYSERSLTNILPKIIHMILVHVVTEISRK